MECVKLCQTVSPILRKLLIITGGVCHVCQVFLLWRTHRGTPPKESLYVCSLKFCSATAYENNQF